MNKKITVYINIHDLILRRSRICNEVGGACSDAVASFIRLSLGALAHIARSLCAAGRGENGGAILRQLH